MQVGVYMDHNSHTAIVVKVDEPHVFFLAMESGEIGLVKTRTASFGRKYKSFMPNYPVIQAVRKFYGNGGGFALKRTDDAQKIMQALIKNANTEAKRKAAGA